MRRLSATALGIGFVSTLAIAQGQVPGQGNPNQAPAKVERAPLYLTSPDRYRVPSLLEPARRVQIMTSADGVLKSLALPVGATTRDGQEVAQLDPAEAIARSKIAQALVKQRQAEYENAKALVAKEAIMGLDLIRAEAQLEGAKAEAELAQIALDRCILRAPFSGRILSVPVSAGQYLPKGSMVVDLADISSLRALVPVDRNAVKVGSNLTVTVEGTGVVAKVQAVLPLDDARSDLRELAAPLGSAWVVIPNTNNAFEPGQRVGSPFLPTSPIASVPSYAIKQDDEGASIVQVIRAERVTDVKVKVIGALGPDRSQVSGSFRPSDALIQSSSVPLTAGTFIRFADAPTTGVEGVTPAPDQYGDPATVGSQRIAPIGSPGATAPARKGTSKPATPRAVVPF